MLSDVVLSDIQTDREKTLGLVESKRAHNFMVLYVSYFIGLLF